MLKVLNLYAGIGGNRKLWKDVEVTAVEINPDIAKIYQKHFPEDTVIVADAHQYLIDHYKEFDFIWASPPCPTHSRLNNVFGEVNGVKYADMKLYQEIILLQNFAPKKTLWVIENVIPYYEYLIPPTQILHRHPFWSNFKIYLKEIHDDRKHYGIDVKKGVYGFNIQEDKTGDISKIKALRNMVNPEIGNYILNCARGILDEEDTKQLKLF